MAYFIFLLHSLALIANIVYTCLMQDMLPLKEYPYMCAFMLHLIEDRKYTYSQIRETYIDMYIWLFETFGELNSLDYYKWCDRKFSLLDQNGNPVQYSQFIFFKHESDLLAFKLRFGITNNV